MRSPTATPGCPDPEHAAITCSHLMAIHQGALCIHRTRRSTGPTDRRRESSVILCPAERHRCSRPDHHEHRTDHLSASEEPVPTRLRPRTGCCGSPSSSSLAIGYPSAARPRTRRARRRCRHRRGHVSRHPTDRPCPRHPPRPVAVDRGRLLHLRRLSGRGHGRRRRRRRRRGRRGRTLRSQSPSSPSAAAWPSCGSEPASTTSPDRRHRQPGSRRPDHGRRCETDPRHPARPPGCRSRPGRPPP